MERALDWLRAQLASTRPTIVPVVNALTPLQSLKGSTQPVLVQCDDGHDYVIKGSQVGRSLIADHVVGALGVLVGAPVPPVAIINVAEVLVQPGSKLAHCNAGPAHGSRFIHNCEDSSYIRYIDEVGNPERFAALAVLFGWTDPEDRQFLYHRREPHVVYSVDHGAFFTGTDNWSVETLSLGLTAECDQFVYGSALVSRQELREAIDSLRSISENEILDIVAGLPEVWGISLDERAVLAHYLISRRAALLGSEFAR
jgi:hypothetical protein